MQVLGSCSYGKKAREPKEPGFVANIVRTAVEIFYWMSPYRWIDRWQAGLESKEQDPSKKQKIREYRYVLDELYIIGWFSFASLLLFIDQLVPKIFVYTLTLRIWGILNKELGVCY